MQTIAILGDIHSNVLALDSILQDLKNCGIEELVFCGDYIGYYYEPSAVVSRLQDLNKPSVIGNHDLALLHLRKTTDSLRSKELHYYYQQNGSGLRIAFETLKPEQIDWLENLPIQIDLKFENVRCSLFHGTPDSPMKYLYPTSPLNEFREFMENSNSQLFLGAHSHHQFSKRIGEKIYVNPGSVGQPRDVGGRAAWAVLRIDGNDFDFDFSQTAYNFREIAAQAKRIDPHIPHLQSIFSRGLNE